MIREPFVAGQFYPRTEDSLRKMLSKLIDASSEKQEAKAIIMPHAGYEYSGHVAGATASRVEIKKTIIILGTNHSGAGKRFGIMTKGSWSTPLGEIRIDAEIAGSILKSSDLIEEDSLSHISEHSIEVELPFFQYLRPDVRIVPISVSRGRIEEYQSLGKDIAEGYKKIGRAALFAASTDLTHHEPREAAEKKDGLAIDAILSLDEERLYTVVEKNNISMCGAAPTCALISICKNLGASRSELVKYQTSGDASGDYSSVVGYAGFVIT